MITVLPTIMTWVVCSSALHMMCSQDDDRTSYMVVGRPTDAECYYSYRNATMHVIAHNTNCTPLVISNSPDGLVTSTCIDEVFYDVSCGKWDHYSANCTVACHDFLTVKERSNDWAAVAVGCGVPLVLLVLLVLVLVVVWKKRRDNYALGRPGVDQS